MTTEQTQTLGDGSTGTDCCSNPEKWTYNSGLCQSIGEVEVNAVSGTDQNIVAFFRRDLAALTQRKAHLRKVYFCGGKNEEILDASAHGADDPTPNLFLLVLEHVLGQTVGPFWVAASYKAVRGLNPNHKNELWTQIMNGDHTEIKQKLGHKKEDRKLSEVLAILRQIGYPTEALSLIYLTTLRTFRLAAQAWLQPIEFQFLIETSCKDVPQLTVDQQRHFFGAQRHVFLCNRRRELTIAIGRLAQDISSSLILHGLRVDHAIFLFRACVFERKWTP